MIDRYDIGRDDRAGGQVHYIDRYSTASGAFENEVGLDNRRAAATTQESTGCAAICSSTGS